MITLIAQVTPEGQVALVAASPNRNGVEKLFLVWVHVLAARKRVDGLKGFAKPGRYRVSPAEDKLHRALGRFLESRQRRRTCSTLQRLKG